MTTLGYPYGLTRRHIQQWRLNFPSLLAALLVIGVLIEPLQVPLLPSGALEGCYAALFLIYMGRLILGRRFTWFELFTLLLIVFVFITGIIIAASPLLATLGTLWILKPILIFLAGVVLAGPSAEKTSTWLAIAGCLLVSATVVAEATGEQWMQTSKGLSGVYTGAAQAAHAAVLGLLLSQRRSIGQSVAWWFALASFLAAVLLTQSRHSLLLAGIAVFPIAGLQRLLSARWAAKVVVVLSLFALGIGTLGQRTTERFQELREIATGREYFRLYALQVGLEAGRENLGLGVGPGRFGGPVANTFSLQAEYQRELTRFWALRGASGRPTTTDVAAAHLLGELGYVGFFFLLCWAGWLAVRHRYPQTTTGLSPPRALLVVGLASLVTFAPVTNGPLQLVLFFLGLGHGQRPRWCASAPYA